MLIQNFMFLLFLRTGKGGREAAVELALNPEEVDMMDTEAMALRAEAALREQQNLLAKEDLSDMVAEHAAKQKNKRKAQAAKDDPKAKKASVLVCLYFLHNSVTISFMSSHDLVLFI